MEEFRENSLLVETFRRIGVATLVMGSYATRLIVPFVHLTRRMSGDSYFRGFLTSRSWFRLPPRRNPFRGWTIFMGDGGDTKR